MNYEFMNKRMIELRCSRCGKVFKPDEIEYTCDCGGILETVYDHSEVRFEGEDMWRYRELLPIRSRTKLHVGGTPLYSFDDENIMVKDETRNPSASLKDRASAVVASIAKASGYKRVSCASTGNAGVSLACLCASEALESYIFVPETASKQKLAQLRAYGANVVTIDATYDECYDICNSVSEQRGLYNRNTAYNPYTIDGKKTVAFEIAEQLDFKVPSYIFVPVGDGCIISGVWKGFKDLKDCGFIKDMPVLIGVQADGCNPLAREFDNGAGSKTKAELKTGIETETTKTKAESIAVCRPRNGFMALRDVRESGGHFVTVSDEEMFDSLKLLASKTGIFAELASASTIAAIRKEKSEKKIDKKDECVAIITGSGLKDGNALELLEGENAAA